MIRKVILTSWRHKRRKRLWWDIKLGGRSEITAKSRRLFVPRRIPSPLPTFLPPPTKSLFVFVFVFVFLQTSTLLTVISKRISLSSPFFHFWLFGLNMCLTLFLSVSASVRCSLFNIPFFAIFPKLNISTCTKLPPVFASNSFSHLCLGSHCPTPYPWAHLSQIS